jgi:tetratricopeptide (TPR) repeat protein
VSDGDAESTAFRARLLVRRAVVHLSQGRYPSARDAAQEAVAVATRANEVDALAQAHLVLHVVQMWSGVRDDQEHGEVALRHFEKLGDLGGQAHALNNLAILRLHQGRWNDALDMYARASEMFQRLGDAANEANASYNLAELLNRQGRHAEAATELDRVMRVARGVGDEELVGLVLREQGRSLSRRGRREGFDLLASARNVLAGLGEPHEVTDTDIALAEADLLSGRPDRALARVDTALEAATSIGAATLLPAAYRVRAAALLDLVDLAAAEHALSEGLRLSAAPEVAHERGFLRVVAARHARLREQLDAARRGVRVPGPRSQARPSTDLQAQAQRELESLGVVAAPLPWS